MTQMRCKIFKAIYTITTLLDGVGMYPRSTLFHIGDNTLWTKVIEKHVVTAVCVDGMSFVAQDSIVCTILSTYCDIFAI